MEYVVSTRNTYSVAPKTCERALEKQINLKENNGEYKRWKMGQFARETSRQHSDDSGETGIYLYDSGSGILNMFPLIFN